MLEETIMDNFQDFFMALEDNHISGYKEEIVWNTKPAETDQYADDGEEVDESTHSIMANLTPSGILGWLTGQTHRSLNGDVLKITVRFDHDCLLRNPNHTTCFPIVGACGRTITIPVAHMSKTGDFQHLFLLAICKGGVFATS